MAQAQILGLTKLSDGYVKLFKARVRLPDGAVVDRELTETGDAVCVLPYDPDRRVAIMVATPRIPVLYAAPGEVLLEAPAGMLDGDPPEVCARKEAMEEAGLELHELEPVAWTWSSPGTSSERISLYLAAYGASDRKGDGGGAEGEHENIVVSERSLAELWALAEAGEAIDLKTFTLLQALKLRRPDLFEAS